MVFYMIILIYYVVSHNNDSELPMTGTLPLVAAQASPRLIGEPLPAFATEVEDALSAYPSARLVVFPELHLFGDGSPDRQRTDALRVASEPLDGPRVEGLREIARDQGVWLVPGSICERGPAGELFNTELVLSPEGEIAGTYRKIFPWRPHEPYDPGSVFATADLGDDARLGLNICYDAWYPETIRQLAWMGAEVILNVVKTTTADRGQELVLARANAIVNQIFMVSVNCAGPVGVGRSIIVGPEGEIIAEAADAEPQLLAAELDLADVARVREHGTAGVNRMWSQFRPREAPINLPVYDGRIDPATWNPANRSPRNAS